MGGNVDMQIKRKEAKLVEKYYHSFQSVEVKQIEEIHGGEDWYKVMLANLKFQGREAVKNKDYLSAEEIYTKAIDLDPDDATLFSNRSLCRLRLGNGKKALTDAAACKSMRPGWSKACYREGAAQMLLKDYEKACGAFLDGLKLEPENAEIESALWEDVESLKISRNNEKE
ncbi:protein STIP1 homolog [Panicum virgatum]|uniref:protein STIP1 homolog n=1 Tax=Panicum virgatum TaxID=38727 RepID=UPI0019D67D8C|nr:protein STIP1 homolog [Panicum virgatum]